MTIAEIFHLLFFLVCFLKAQFAVQWLQGVTHGSVINSNYLAYCQIEKEHYKKGK